MFTDYPVMLEDDSVIADESGAFAKATSIDPEIGPAHILGSDPMEDPKNVDCVAALTAPKPPTEPLNRSASPDRALPQHLYGRVVRKDNRVATPIVSPPSAITPPPPQQSKARTPTLEQDK